MTVNGGSHVVHRIRYHIGTSEKKYVITLRMCSKILEHMHVNDTGP